MRDYWDGATWLYQAQITNDADGSGAIEVEVVPGAGNEMEVLAVDIVNGDTVARTLSAYVDDASGGNAVILLFSGSTAAGSRRSWPSNETGDDAGAHSHKLIVSGTMALRLRAAGVAASQDASFGIIARVRGDSPDAAESGNGTAPTITVNTETII